MFLIGLITMTDVGFLALILLVAIVLYAACRLAIEWFALAWARAQIRDNWGAKEGGMKR